MKKFLSLLVAGLLVMATGAQAATPNTLDFLRTPRGGYVYLPPAPAVTYQLALAAGTGKNFSTFVSDGCAMLTIAKHDVDYYSKKNTTSGTPTIGSDVTDGSAWDWNSKGYNLIDASDAAVTSIRFYATVAGDITVNCYK